MRGQRNRRRQQAHLSDTVEANNRDVAGGDTWHVRHRPDQGVVNVVLLEHFEIWINTKKRSTNQERMNINARTNRP